MRALLGNLLSVAISLLGLALLLELGLRLVSLSSDPRALVYPRVANGINGFQDGDFEQEIPRGEFRILALGASAFVTREFQPRVQALLDENPFFREKGLKVRLVSTGVPAHMTYDSLWKYRYWYEGYDFDLVIFYHGINDARANNYPREVFRDDYTQFSYYQRFRPAFDWIDAHPRLSRSFLVSWVMKLALGAKSILAPDFQREAPYNNPLDDPWREQAGDLKTPPVFRRNVEAVIEIAAAREQPLLLLTYAYYVPEGYSNERFMKQDLDYAFAPESVATEVWGWSYHVQAAIEAHDAVIRELAAENPQLLFFDMERYMPKSGKYFIDICHWTDLGQRRFAQGIVEALRARPDVMRAALERR
ncbi:MAG TPA: hypothetical protein VEC18_07355 [Myxococcota bacterium]|nr:hypothetical protein [Myxococcota bacterium]